MREKLVNFLLWPGDEHPFLLLIQCCLELFLHLLSCFSVEKLALPAFKRDFCCPPTVFTPVNGAFTTSAFCHKGTPFFGCPAINLADTPILPYIAYALKLQVPLGRSRVRVREGVN